jgi:hypothetical protein
MVRSSAAILDCVVALKTEVFLLGKGEEVLRA